MPVAMLVDNPEGTAEIYDKGRHQFDAEQPAGSIFHIAGPGPDGGVRVINVWQSEEDAYRFLNECLKPAFDAVGVPGPPAPPQFWPVHNHVKQSRSDQSWPR